MPAFQGKLEKDQVWALVEYLKILRTARPQAVMLPIPVPSNWRGRTASVTADSAPANARPPERGTLLPSALLTK